jgi:hypothetical protein
VRGLRTYVLVGCHALWALTVAVACSTTTTPVSNCGPGTELKSGVCVPVGSGGSGGSSGGSGATGGSTGGAQSSGGGGSGQGGTGNSTGAGGTVDPSGGAGDGGEVSAGGAGGESGGVGECLPQDYDALGELDGTASWPLPAKLEFSTMELPGGGLPDMLRIELYPGYGAFPTDLTTLDNFVIEGDELSYATCGFCVLLFSEIDGIDYDKVYFQTGGTVTLTSVEGNLTGHIDDFTFVEVVPDGSGMSFEPVADGCTTTITSVSFDAVIP